MRWGFCRRLAPLVVLASLVVAAPARAATVAPEPQGERRRYLDLEFHPLFSVPDALGVCIEGFPLRRGLSVAGCASIQIYLAAALNLNVVYRFPLHVTPTFSLSLGPGVGSHAIADNPRGPWIDVTVDGFASFEAVWWRDTTGFQVQLGAGAMRVVWDRPEGIDDKWIPIVDLTLGFAFRSANRYFHP
jgi:hypothetical protein